MENVNPVHMIDELRYNIEKKDIIKASLVLSCLNQVDEKSQKRLLFELVRAEPVFKVPMLAFLLSNKKELCKSFPVIKETLVSTLLENRGLLLELLNDKNAGDKEVFIDFAGEIEFEEAAPAIRKLVTESRDHNIIITCIKALKRLSDPESITILSDYLYSGNREFTIEAVKALGQIGTPTAMQRLAERLGSDHEIDVNIMKVFAKVQDSISLEMLNKAIQSHHAHMRNFAKTALVKIGTKSVPVIIKNLQYDDPDFQIHSLNVLGAIEDPSAVGPIRKLLHNEPKNPNVRFAAYEALSLLPAHEGAFTLAAGLTDPVENVSVAAANAIDRNFNHILEAGIKNMIKDKDDDAQKIVKTIINSMSDKIFLSLAPETYFQDMAMAHISNVHVDIRKHYAKLLNKNNQPEFANMIRLDSEKEEKDRPKVYAVDDSRMILNVYKSILHEIGLDATLFEFPIGAIEALDNEKPDLIFTDLNMPDITGIELAKKIRDRYSEKSLPIIMVTTQNEANDNEAAIAAGVNKIIYKPFDAEKIKEAAAEFIDI